jgi:hypothetical protein
MFTLAANLEGAPRAFFNEPNDYQETVLQKITLFVREDHSRQMTSWSSDSVKWLWDPRCVS